MVSRLHAKTNQIGKLLNNLEKYNHFMKDGEGGRSPTTPSDGIKMILNKSSPLSPKEPFAPDARMFNRRSRDFSSFDERRAFRDEARSSKDLTSPTEPQKSKDDKKKEEDGDKE